MVFADFNAHHSSWFSRTGDDRVVARGEALDEAINSSQLAVANQDISTRLPSQGQPSSPNITLVSGHLLPDTTWSTLATFGSDHLPLTVTLSIVMPRFHRGMRVLLRTSPRLTGRNSQQSQRGTSLRHQCQPPDLLGKIFSSIDTISSPVMYGITAALSPMLCDPSSRREISAALMTTSTLPSSCWLILLEDQDQ